MMTNETGSSNKGRTGECHVCGQNKLLSFEHIPPQSVGNRHKVLVYSGEEAIEAGSFGTGNVGGLKYRQQQRGLGFQTLCRDCNSYLGNHYVRPFDKFLLASVYGIRNPDRHLIAIDHEHRLCQMTASSLQALAFSKQVVSNFCTVTTPGGMSDCRDYLLNCEDNRFPERYRLHMYLLPDLTGPSIFSDWITVIYKDRQYLTFAVVAFPPFGFILCDLDYSDAIPDKAGDVTDLTRTRWSDAVSAQFTLPVIEGDLARRPFFWIQER
ncbi:hypothetical protein OZX74_01355 [Bifidobacterium sp. ESL0798]|uniref:hypothetical protein n=1 Tax=Bifidobacterium sp. ESL0798 TaxID=2983235 RepID=UPI0023F892C3|nr:hypothetical protein [Bifidobacterium sp. ESL0798]WEV74240.1 hypothetical protein OZX74_01355 [Bifidobacterium sp. ESL0798]